MGRHSVLVSLRQMLDYAREAIALVRDRERADLDSDRLLGLGVVRLLEIIGEAAARVPEDERLRMPGIPWSQVVGLRNRLIHGYDTTNHDIVWQVLTGDLPPLAEALEHAIAQRESWGCPERHSLVTGRNTHPSPPAQSGVHHARGTGAAEGLTAGRRPPLRHTGLARRLPPRAPSCESW